MSKSAVAPFFPIKDISSSNLRHIQIIDVSEDLYCGRRFQVLYVDAETDQHLISKAVRFSKIVKRINKISKDETDLESLIAIKAFLSQLSQVEKDAKSSYKARSCFYRLLTSIQRMFKSGSHLKRIDALRTDIQEKINQQDATNVDFEARMAPIRKMEFKEFQTNIHLLIEDCILSNQLDDALNASGMIMDYKVSDELYMKIARAFIEKGNYAKAAYAVERISHKKHEKIEVIQEIVSAYLSHENPDLDAALRVISYIPSNEDNFDVIYSLTSMVQAHQI